MAGHGLLVAHVDGQSLLQSAGVLQKADNVLLMRHCVAFCRKQKPFLKGYKLGGQPKRFSESIQPSHAWQERRLHKSRFIGHSKSWTVQNTAISSLHVASNLEAVTDLTTKKGFHQRRFTATKRLKESQQEELAVQIREPTSEAELNAIAVLRALSFYAYRPERAFAGKLHQKMKAGEEYERLLQLRKNSSNAEQQEACLAAFCRWETVLSSPEELRVTSSEGEDLVVVGSLDVCASRGVEGQVLRGSSSNAAYLVNVCVSEAARRRRVGRSLLDDARRRAHDWGVEALYVHTMAVNEVAQEFYRKHGFVLEQEESSNEAHYRGHCLDGIEGRGRTVLLRDERFALPDIRW